jgi:hypothetical protein
VDEVTEWMKRIGLQKGDEIKVVSQSRGVTVIQSNGCIWAIDTKFFERIKQATEAS